MSNCVGKEYGITTLDISEAQQAYGNNTGISDVMDPVIRMSGFMYQKV